MGITATGLGSGLDVNSIVNQLMALERRPVSALDRKEAMEQAKLSAYGSLKGAFASFQAAMSALSTTSKFAAYSVSSNALTTVGATLSGTPAPGSYSLEVTTLAQSQKLVAEGQASETAEIGSGATTTLTFDFGTISGGSFDANTGLYSGATFASGGSGTKTVTINETNNTLTGIRDAINAADIGVTATIVNDGGATPYRLVFTSDSMGADKSMKISVSGDATIEGLLAHDPAGTQELSETVTGKNAAFKVDGISISKSSNIVTDAIPGVSLNLLKTTDDGPIKVTVTQDKNQITASVNGFVKAYNDLTKTLKELSKYDPATKQGSILTGDATVRTMQAQLRGVLAPELTGVSSSYKRLSDIGVSFQTDGTLAVNSSKLQAAIASNPDAVAAMFAAAGSASDPLATYVGATSATKPGTYALSVSSLATQGSLTGSAAAQLTITEDVNDALQITVDGIATTVTIPAGTYTAAQLATAVQSAINGNDEFSDEGIAVTVTQSGGVLTVKSDRYGSASVVEVTGGNGATDLFGATPTTTDGEDIAGTINGETASGSGQTLTGPTGYDSEGLKFKITGGATASRGVLYYSTGYAYQLEALASRLLDTEGALASRTEGINKTIEDIGDRREALNTRLAAVEKRYRAQFTALDTAMSSMTRTSTFLQQQLANLPKITGE